MDNQELFELSKSFMRTDRFHRTAVESAVKALGIHRSQHMMLMHLACCPEPQTQVELAKAFEISAAAVTVTLQKLEKAGLVSRSSSGGDERLKVISLTENGKAMVEKTRELFRSIDEAMFADITEEELTMFASCMTRMQDNLRKYSPEVATLDS